MLPALAHSLRKLAALFFARDVRAVGLRALVSHCGELQDGLVVWAAASRAIVGIVGVS